MIEVGNLRIRMKDKTIWGTILDQKPETSFIIDCPFTKESGIKNVLNNGYDFTFFPDASTETGEYVGGIITCNNINFDLTKEWSVNFEYIYTGKLTSDEIKNSTTTLASNWNIIFGFGRHILDKDKVEDPKFALPINSFDDKTNKVITAWCTTINVNLWKRYSIVHDGIKTTVTINNEPQETKQCDYPNKIQGFFMSGGGYYHSLPCKIKNFTLYGTVVS